MNRCIFLALPDFKINDIYEVVRPIDESYGNNLYYNNKDDFNKLIKIYHEYKLNDIKNNEFISNYHGLRDLYNLVKIFANDLNEKIEKKEEITQKYIDRITEKAVMRNFEGLEIDGESSIKKFIKSDINLDNIKTMDLIKYNILSKDSRFLLIISERSMFDFLIIFKEISKINKDNKTNSKITKKIELINFIGSPFIIN